MCALRSEGKTPKAVTASSTVQYFWASRIVRHEELLSVVGVKYSEILSIVGVTCSEVLTIVGVTYSGVLTIVGLPYYEVLSILGIACCEGLVVWCYWCDVGTELYSDVVL